VSGRVSAFRQQPFEIERPGEHGELAVGAPRPFGHRSIAVKFHAVPVGIAEVKRLADPVVGGSVEGDAGFPQPPQGIGQRGGVRVEDRRVVW
jgi:hypothetical protein